MDSDKNSCRKTITLRYTKQYGIYRKTGQNEAYSMKYTSANLIVKVGLQMPEGLLVFACTIADILERQEIKIHERG